MPIIVCVTYEKAKAVNKYTQSNRRVEGTVVIIIWLEENVWIDQKIPYHNLSSRAKKSGAQ